MGMKTPCDETKIIVGLVLLVTIFSPPTAAHVSISSQSDQHHHVINLHADNDKNYACDGCFSWCYFCAFSGAESRLSDPLYTQHIFSTRTLVALIVARSLFRLIDEARCKESNGAPPRHSPHRPSGAQRCSVFHRRLLEMKLTLPVAHTLQSLGSDCYLLNFLYCPLQTWLL